MSLRYKIDEDYKKSIKNKEQDKINTLRLIRSAIKDKDISLRNDSTSDGVSDKEILSILAKMIKQRSDSIRQYEEAGRIELAEGERAEVRVIEEFLPEKLTVEEIEKAISKAIESIGAKSIRDMGKVMGQLKESFEGQVDFNIVSQKVKEALSN